MRGSTSITNKTNGTLPRVPFARIKDTVLGKAYELSVAVVPPRESHRLNRAFRGKDNPTNVLSFPYSKNSGELVLDVATSRKQAPDFGMTAQTFLVYLVIHGMLHLKGYDHGSRMEKEEKKFLKTFAPTWYAARSPSA